MAKILVIDDEPGVRFTLKVILEGDGHEVLQAEDGEEGLAVLTTNLGDVDVVITDIMMPKLDGVMVIDVIRRVDPDVPLIAISGGGNKITTNDPLKTASKHTVAALRKPFTKEELREALAKALPELADDAESSTRG